MAAVASELEAAVPTITTTTAATDDGGPAEPGPVGPGHLKFPSEPNGAAEFGPCRKLEDHEEGRPDRPESEPEAGRGPESGVLLDRTEIQVDRMNLSDFPVDRTGSDRVTPGLPADSESGGSYRTILPDPQHSAVFLHSLPDPPPGTEAGLSLAEPAEPTTNVTTDRAEAAERDRVYLGLMQADLGPGPAEDSVCDGTAERTEPGTGCREEPAVQVVLDPSSSSTGPEPTSVLDLSPGSEVRVCLDHVIDDALVVSFRVGEQVFSGVLMDVSKRFGPYGIPITTFPRRDERSQPPASLLPVSVDNETSTKQEEVSSAPRSPPPSQPWSSRPPPLFQEGAPYPPPLFIRDTYNQALPQPPPRKIKRPKRRYRCEEPTSIMNAIKLRPRQVLCDKCKGVVSGGYREARRGPVELRSHEVLRRRRAADMPLSTELKRLRGDDRGGRSAPERRSSSGIPVSSSSSSSSSRRILRGVTSSSTASSSQEHSKLNSKKVLAKSSAADRSKSRQVLQKLVPHHLPTHPDKNQNQNRSKAVTRAASLQSHNQKVHFTRRLQHLSSAGASAHPPLPPRMRLKPQRYRTDEPVSPPKPATPSGTAPPPSIETAQDEGAGPGNDWQEVEPPPPSSFSSLDSSHSECSSTETFELPPSGDLHSYSSDPAPLPPSPPSSSSDPTPLPPSPPSSSLLPHCPASSYPAQLTANGENEEEGGDAKRRRKLSSSSSSSSSSSVFSKSVSKCLLPDGRTVCVGDIVWAKIYGFPWWPARVLGITVARRGDTGLAVRQEARVSWFGSPTTSFLPLPQLSPFLETFQSRFDKKRKGPYRRAIAEAASAAKQLTPEVRALLTQFET